MSKISPKGSFRGWNIWKFIKGRKKTAVTLVSMLCIHFLINPELTGLLAGGAIFEGIWSVAEYFLKER